MKSALLLFACAVSILATSTDRASAGEAPDTTQAADYSPPPGFILVRAPEAPEAQRWESHLDDALGWTAVGLSGIALAVRTIENGQDGLEVKNGYLVPKSPSHGVSTTILGISGLVMFFAIGEHIGEKEKENKRNGKKISLLPKLDGLALAIRF